MKNRIANYKEFKDFLATIENKPSLLLHACCGPCTSGVLDRLTPFFKITIYYANDNIDTLEEFKKRQEELLKVSEKYDIEVVTKLYEPAKYDQAVLGHEEDGEFSLRCYKCMEERLLETAKYAKEHNFAYFTTTLSISPYKSSKWINEIGYQLSDQLGVDFLYSDFKKEEGYKLSVQKSGELGLYRQHYCGCKYSLLEYLEKEENKNAPKDSD